MQTPVRFVTEYSPICCDTTRDLWTLVNVKANPSQEQHPGSTNSGPERTWGADVLFLIDVSGSMLDEGKLDRVKETLRFILEAQGKSGLTSLDRICLMAFNGGMIFCTDGFIRMDDEEKKKQALKFIDEELRPNGSTDLDLALTVALEEFDNRSRDIRRERNTKIIVLLTDGLPTAGETDRTRIISNAAKNNKETRPARIFAIGFGLDHDASLLAALPNSRYAYVRGTESIPGIMGEIMGDALSVVCWDACITLEACPGCRIVSIGGRFQKETILAENKKVEIKLGDLSLGDVRNILVKTSLRPSTLTSDDGIFARNLYTACLTYIIPDASTPSGFVTVLCNTVNCSVPTTSDKGQETSQTRNSEIQEQMNRLTSLDAIEQADALFRKGRSDEAVKVLNEAQKCIESTPVGDQPYSKNLLDDLGNCIKSLQLKSEADKTLTSCGTIYSSEKASGHDSKSCSNKRVYTTEACTKLSKNYEKLNSK